MARIGLSGGAIDRRRRGCRRSYVAWRTASLAALLAAACCAGTNRRAGHATLDLADRYERGDGVPRDFRKAAELLARECAEGRGNGAACRRLAIARARGRGTSVDPLSAGPLLAAACAHGDWLACGGPIPFDEAQARAACANGSHEACLAVDSLEAWRQSGALDDERRSHVDAACRANVLEGCYAIPRADIDTGDDRTALALARLGAACRRGDVDACAAVGTPIPPRELCDAGDFESCAAIDDEATLTVACDNKVAKACERLGIRGLEREPPDPRAATYLERACRFGAPKACNYKKSPDVPATGCEGLSVYVIDSAHRRKVPHLHGTNVGGANWSAPPGPILVLFETGDVPSAAYDQIAEHLDVPVLISIEAGGVAARPNLKRAVRVLIDASVAHEHAANGTHPVAGHEIASTNALIDSDDVVRAVFWGVPSEPVSFARCVRHVLQSL